MIELALAFFHTFAVLVALILAFMGFILMCACIIDRMKWLVTGKANFRGDGKPESMSAILAELNHAVFRT